MLDNFVLESFWVIEMSRKKFVNLKCRCHVVQIDNFLPSCILVKSLIILENSFNILSSELSNFKKIYNNFFFKSMMLFAIHHKYLEYWIKNKNFVDNSSIIRVDFLIFEILKHFHIDLFWPGYDRCPNESQNNIKLGK